MHEIEIKFQVDPAARDAVAAEVAGPEPAGPLRLQAAYFDTVDRALAGARMALRVRREGDRWVQTLKGAADDGMTRLEHNVALATAADETPAVDPSLHADSPIGDRLAALVAAAPGGLACLYRTDVRRQVRRVRGPHGSVELAFDEGEIRAGAASLALCELEIELVEGSSLAVVETARHWVARHQLVQDTRSKSERGDMLARGDLVAPPRLGRRVPLDPGRAPADTRRALLRACLESIGVHASQVASGAFEAAHVQRLRAGLRRLRMATARSPDVTDAALGASADALSRAMAVEASDPVAIARGAALQSLWLDLLAAARDRA